MKNSQHQNLSRKNSTAGKSGWFPLPPSLLDVIFDPNVAPKLLGSFMSSSGEWDRDNGIYKHHSSGLYLVVVSSASGIEGCIKHIKSHGSPESIREKTKGLDPSMVDKAFSEYCRAIGENISIVHPYEYNTLNYNELIRKHFGDDLGWCFLQEGSLDFPGTIRVKSAPNTLSSEDIPVSHSSQIRKSYSQARSKPSHKSFRFKEEASILESMFDNETQGQYVSNVRPNLDAHPISRNVENVNGTITFLENSNSKVAPTASIGNDSFINTANYIQDGSIKKATLEGPYIRNANPAYPSSHFYPHADWLSTLFVFPRSIIRDPQTAATMIGIALLISQGQEHTKYISSYNKVTSVIDNEELEKDLFK